MRTDIFTAEDRYAEAMEAYRDQQIAQYASWALGGAVVISLLLGSILISCFPEYITARLGDQDALNSADISRIYSEHGFFGGLGLMSFFCVMSGRGTILCAILFCIFAILGFSHALPIAIYQGIVFGFITTIICYFVVSFGLDVLGVPGPKTIGWILGGGLGTLVLLSGVMGAFLPEV